MIKNHSRAYWFGASDTAMIMGRWDTQTFYKWWLVKCGAMPTPTWSTKAMRAGTHYEHRILDALSIAKRDRQIRIRRLRLRVNLDGEDKKIVHEVKTHGKPKFSVSKAYWQQAQVEMYATKKRLVINAYHLTEEDYNNYFNEIDKARLSEHPIEYDKAWIKEQYLPRLKYLAWCLRHHKQPKESEYLEANR
jgi:hypothetical protein